MDEITPTENTKKSFFYADARDIFILIVMLAALVVASSRVLFAPEPIQTVYTAEEAATIQSYEEQIGNAGWADTPSDVANYVDTLRINLDSSTTCAEKSYDFKTVEDLLAFQNVEFSKMENVNGEGSCLTFSGFPKSEVSNAEKVALDAMRSVVRIKDGYAYGTGFIVASDLILTNYHVIADGSDVVSKNIEIETYAGETMRATYVSGDARADVALIKTEKPIKNAAIAKLASEPTRIGEPVVTIGHPSSNKAWTATVGVYYTSEPNLYNVESGLYSLPSIGGVSGSPIFNMQGEVVAMVYGAREVSGSRNIASRYSVPLHTSIISDFAVSKAVLLENLKKYAN